MLLHNRSTCVTLLFRGSTPLSTIDEAARWIGASNPSFLASNRAEQPQPRTCNPPWIAQGRKEGEFRHSAWSAIWDLSGLQVKGAQPGIEVGVAWNSPFDDSQDFDTDALALASACRRLAATTFISTEYTTASPAFDGDFHSLSLLSHERKMVRPQNDARLRRVLLLHDMTPELFGWKEPIWQAKRAAIAVWPVIRNNLFSSVNLHRQCYQADVSLLCWCLLSRRQTQRWQ